jgi:hypothetical protein
MKFYYVRPSPERLVGELRAVPADALAKPHVQLAFATFLGRVMAANPRRIRTWFAELADLRGDVRDTFRIAAWMSGTAEARGCLEAVGADATLLGAPPDILAAPVDEPAYLDMLWSWYFATGDARAVRRIVSALRFLSDYGAAGRYEASAQTAEDAAAAVRDSLFRAASWSLASLMADHPPLVDLCGALVDDPTLDGAERLALALTLEKVDPRRWRVQMDRATGEWHIERSRI